MCGFVTYFGQWQEYEPYLEQSLNNIYHRGPNDRHVIKGENYWIGFCRLAIIDTSLNGRQPMSFDNGRYILVFNGEIYNFQEIKNSLAPTHYNTNTDTEVLGNTILKLGIDKALNVLRGMFSFVWFDTQTNSLYTARDHFGIKPLYFYQNNNSLILASEFRSILNLSPQDVSINPLKITEYFSCGNVGTPNTLFKNINTLPPAHLATYTINDELKYKPYWEVSWQETNNDLQISEASLFIRESVNKSVKRHLNSDVPLGVFLSGGLDSSIICASMQSMGANIKAFSLGWSDEDGVEDESQIAKKTADFYNVDFHHDYINSEQVFNTFDNYINALDHPTGDGLNTYLISKLASQDVTVVLNGIGADEFAGGYGFHRMLALANKLPLFKFTPKYISKFLNKTYNSLPQEFQSRPEFRTLALASGAYGKDLISIIRNSRSVFNLKQLNKLLRFDSENINLSLFNPYQKSYTSSSKELTNSDIIHQLLLFETKGYMLNTLLRDADNLSMAHSLELRVPFVDVDLFEDLAKVPSHLKVNTNEGKIILRKAFFDILPSHITQDTRKKGFNLPMMKWLKQPMWKERIQDTLNSKNLAIENFCHRDEILNIVNKYYNNPSTSKLAFSYYQRLWLCFILELFLKKCNL